MSGQLAIQDIVILVMGATGAGRSTFINYLAGPGVMPVGTTLNSCTTDVQETSLSSTRYPGYRLVVVDTPGLDGSHGKSDKKIFAEIVKWLERHFKQHQTAIFGGVIYLHDVSTDHFSKTAGGHFDTFQRLFRIDSLNRVVIGTTKWERTDRATADTHHAELRDEHLKPQISKGAHFLKFGDSEASAWSFVDRLVSTLSLEQQERARSRVPREVGVGDKTSQVLPSQRLREYLCF